MEQVAIEPMVKRGRPKTGRKETLQIPMDKPDLDAIRAHAEATDQPVADVARRLMKGELRWSDLKTSH